MPLRSITEKCVVSSGSGAAVAATMSLPSSTLLEALRRIDRRRERPARDPSTCSFADRHLRRSRDRRGSARDRGRRGASPRPAGAAPRPSRSPFDFRSIRLEDVQHLDQRHAAGAGRRHRDDLVAAERASNRRALLRCVRREIGLRDQAAVGRHVLGDAIGDPSLVEDVGAVRRDRAQRLAEVLQHEAIARRPMCRRRACRTPRPTPETGPSCPRAAR